MYGKHVRRLGIAGLGTAALMLAAPPAAMGVDLERYDVRLKPLNGSGVHGTGTFTYDRNADELTVRLNVNNVIPDQLHPQHIHGFTDGDPVEGKDAMDEAVCPTGSSRNQIEGLPEEAERPHRSLAVEEGLDEYGPVLLPLTPFPTPEGRSYVFVQTYSGDDLDALNLDEVPLERRAIVIHGGLVDGPDRDGRPETYVVTLPVACGAIAK